MFRETRCIRCGACQEVCEQGGISWDGETITTDGEKCTLCGACVDACYAQAREMIGQEMTVAQVMAEIERDVAFYDESGGGATFSGGEPLARRGFLLALLRACAEKEIHTAVDTCGFATWEAFDAIRRYVDLFLYDLKLMDDAKHRKFTGVSNESILRNLRMLAERGDHIVLRVPIIPEITDDDENLRQIGAFAAALPGVSRVDILPYHHAAVEKYSRLQKTYGLDSREKISFAVSPQARQVYQDTIIPFWQGRSMRDLIFQEMTEEWKAAYDAGVFTEFMEQRSPGHTVLDDKIYHKGLLGFKADIQHSLEGLDYVNDPDAYEKGEQLKAMDVCADGLIRFAERHAEKARELAGQEADPQRRKELERIAEVCSHVPAHAPRDFWEALQYYWFVHLGVTIELNPWDAFCPGKLDQHLYPFYKKGLEEGTLTREQAQELLQCFWIKFNNQPAPPKVGVTAQESSTYTDFVQINAGGVNEVTYLILDVIEEMRLLQPSSSVQVSKKNPDRFVKRAAKIIRTGFGQPSIFNSDLVVQEMVRVGKSVADARNGGTNGLNNLVHLVRTYFKLDGHHIQFNVIDAATLRAAQQNPGQYRDLIVRVAGYSDYFCDLGPALQKEIIGRTEHQSF